ncbi:ANTAR domain-containing response regulator [Geodermatophilus sp. SYSU D00708]
MGETTHPSLQDRLQLAESLLRAIEEGVLPLQRLLSEVRKEVQRALREELASSRDEEVSALRREVDQLREGMTSRAAIERAKGILMQCHGISESQSFDLLNEMSHRQRRKLRELAADIAGGPVGSPPARSPTVAVSAECPANRAPRGTATGTGDSSADAQRGSTGGASLASRAP